MYKATRRQTLKLALLAALGASSMTAPEARAADATFMRAALTLDEPGERSGLFLSSSFEFDLPQALSEALHRGIALYFVHEFRLYKERWYWIDKATIRCRFMIRLAFDPLTGPALHQEHQALARRSLERRAQCGGLRGRTALLSGHGQASQADAGRQHGQ